MEEFLQQLILDVKDIFEKDIKTTKAYVVPTRDDSSLTFTTGSDKQGKLIETCVLMIDIRNSTQISRKLYRDKIKLGKIYSAFVYAMTNIADRYGYVRNIIGDRVMVVFEPQNCFVDAINCAAEMYAVSNRILAKLIGLEEFKVGIGIDYGELLVLKTGIRKNYNEKSEYKGLVWVGNAANIASKLCDMANKKYNSPRFVITYEVFKIENLLDSITPTQSDSILSHLLNLDMLSTPKKRESELNTIELDLLEFSKYISNGSDGLKYNGQKVARFYIKDQSGQASPILISGKVYDGYKRMEPKSKHLQNLSAKDYPDKPCYPVYGGSLIIPDFFNIKV